MDSSETVWLRWWGGRELWCTVRARGEGADDEREMGAYARIGRAPAV